MFITQKLIKIRTRSFFSYKRRKSSSETVLNMFSYWRRLLLGYVCD